MRFSDSFRGPRSYSVPPRHYQPHSRPAQPEIGRHHSPSPHPIRRVRSISCSSPPHTAQFITCRVIPLSKRRTKIRPHRSAIVPMDEEEPAHSNQQQRREKTGTSAEPSLRVTRKRNWNRRIIIVLRRIPHLHQHRLRLKHKSGFLDGSPHRLLHRPHMLSYVAHEPAPV